MRTIEATGRVSEDGTLTVRVPPDVTPGDHKVVLLIDEDAASPTVPASSEPDTSSEDSLSDAERQRRFVESWTVHHVGNWPEGLSLRREDMYGDDGR